MNHGDHTGHDMPMPDSGSGGHARMCSMNMLWNSQVEDVCVVFKSWHISGWGTMILSCLAIIFIGAVYAWLLNHIKILDRRTAILIHTSSNPRRDGLVGSAGPAVGTVSDGERGPGEGQSLIPFNQAGYSAIDTGAGRTGLVRLPLLIRVHRALLYAAAVALSFWLMLVAMTYNTFLFFSIVIGAFVGHILYEAEIDLASLGANGSKGLACH